MQNKNSKINTVLLIVILILLGVVVFLLFKNNTRVKDNSIISTPDIEISDILDSSQNQDSSNTKKEEVPTSPKNENLSALEIQFNDFQKKYNFKYKTFLEAKNIFLQATNKNMTIERIDLYVPGKIPHEDGNPYFIGRGTINESENKCIKGYMNLVTGETKSWEDVCIIYN